MAKYGVIIALLANLIASRALEDPDLIRNCGDAKALALGLPATTRGSQLYQRLYKMSLTPLPYHPDRVQEGGAKSTSLNIAEASPSINLAAQHYDVTEGPSAYTSARQSLNAIKVRYDSSAKVAAPVISLLRSPVESFSSLPHSHLTFTPLSSFSHDGAEKVVLKYNPPNQYENAPVLKYSFKPINYQAVNFNDASTTSHTNSRLVESFASTSTKNASSASSYVSVSSPITSKVSNADTSVNVKENIYGLNFASQILPRPFSQMARVLLIAPVTKQVQNNVAASPVVNSPTAPAVSTSYIRVVSGIREGKYPTSDENYNGRATLASATQPINKAEEKRKGSDQDKYYDAHPRYTFEYKVHDVHTGDQKEQKEQREGDVVNGHYSLLQPDGNVRTVTYNADWETGFHAQVKYSKKL